MTKRSKSLEVVTDTLVGVKPYEKRDFFNGCNEPGKPWFQRDAHEFIRIYCKICRNRQCLRALGAKTPWQTRMEEQVDYLINNPIYSDFTSIEHQNIANLAWESLKQKAERLEIAARRQDWEIPEGPTDGFPRVAEKEVTENFDEAVKALAKAQGKKEPELPLAQSSEGPLHFNPEEDSPPLEQEDLQSKDAVGSSVEYETQYPSSDGSKKYRVALESGRWSCSCAGFQRTTNCKHLVTVRSWYEDQLRQAEEKQQESQEDLNESPTLPAATTPSTRGHNTPMPEGGVLLGGGPSSSQGYQPMTPKPHPERDPWSPTSDQVVKPGAQVVIKTKKK